LRKILVEGINLANRIFAIGDVHGCLDQLDTLLQSLALKADDYLIMLGDLVDRGPKSAGVLGRVRSLSQTHRVIVIKGNHEQMMLDARQSHDKFADWLKNGGDATLHSYAGVRGTLRDVIDEDWQFLSNQLVDYFEDDRHLFVHANAYPDMSLEEQPDYMLRWERCDKMVAHESGKIIVCGHTPQKSGQPLNLGYGICLDTNACAGGPLTCMETGSGKIWQAMPGGKIERSHISDYGCG
jgi:serine/threonine protein phosphatase 1